MASKERQYLTAITVEMGIITLVEEDGEIGYYRQRGIEQILPAVRQVLVSRGALHQNWEQFKALPRHYSISYEDEAIMGRAYATYRVPKPLKEMFNIK